MLSSWYRDVMLTFIFCSYPVRFSVIIFFTPDPAPHGAVRYGTVPRVAAFIPDAVPYCTVLHRVVPRIGVKEPYGSVNAP